MQLGIVSLYTAHPLVGLMHSRVREKGGVVLVVRVLLIIRPKPFSERSKGSLGFLLSLSACLSHLWIWSTKGVSKPQQSGKRTEFRGWGCWRVDCICSYMCECMGGWFGRFGVCAIHVVFFFSILKTHFFLNQLCHIGNECYHDNAFSAQVWLFIWLIWSAFCLWIKVGRP